VRVVQQVSQSSEDDRRDVTRRFASAPALVLDPSTGQVIACVLRNFSARGAKLKFDQPTALPSHFDLIIPFLGDTYAAARRWSHGDLVGVEFTDAFPRKTSEVATTAGVDLGTLLNAAEAENARLRRVIADAHRPPPPTVVVELGTSADAKPTWHKRLGRLFRCRRSDYVSANE
jgi:hypothetical protein